LPTAWAKLLFLLDRSTNEVGRFGISMAEDLLYVQDVALVSQRVAGASVSFDDESVVDFFEAQVDLCLLAWGIWQERCPLGRPNR
jgi:hypothetical protein